MVARNCRGTLGVEVGYKKRRKGYIYLDEPPPAGFSDTKEIQRKRSPPLNNPRLLFSLILSAVTYGARTERRSAGSVLCKNHYSGFHFDNMFLMIK